MLEIIVIIALVAIPPVLGWIYQTAARAEERAFRAWLMADKAYKLALKEGKPWLSEPKSKQ